MEIEMLKTNLVDSLSYMDDIDRKVIEDVITYAERAHHGQERGSGEPFIMHPINVALILSNYHCDTHTIVAALLHDVVEDTDYSLNNIETYFGKEVAEIVDGLTKIKKSPDIKKEYYEAFNIQKLLLAAGTDIRVIIIKLADRLHNMRTLEHKPRNKQLITAKQTLEFYVPLADKLGIKVLKKELEDLAFFYIDKEAYLNAKNRLDEIMREKKSLIYDIYSIVKEGIIKNNKDVTTFIDYESYYKIHLEKTDINKSLALIVLTDEISDCYEILGKIHTFWKHGVGNFEDNININKNQFNKHLKTEISINNTKLIVIIQTKLQHRLSLLGTLGVVLYENRLDSNNKKDTLFFLKERVDKAFKISKEDALIFYNQISEEYFKDGITIYTPKMDSIHLPENSTVIDFAYSLDPKSANKIVYAFINEQRRSIYSKLKNNDIVNLVIDENVICPTYDRIQHCSTSPAIYEIENFLLKMQNEIRETMTNNTHIENNKNLFNSRLDKYHLKYAKCCNPNLFDNICLKINDQKKIKVVHTTDCLNILNGTNYDIMDIDWTSKLLTYYEFSLELIGEKNIYTDVDLLKKIQDLNLVVEIFQSIKKRQFHHITIRIRMKDYRVFDSLFKTLFSEVEGIQTILKHDTGI
ncbi:HD domain-containing protein [Bacillus pseudomycoides]|uniref:HD domain-containing protein n=1 Tax=Bacillus pseudomycoides TaxID=64104 RepID=UPI000BF6CC71|nr:HD domain-containing protein [Bacillus pseudomycoides]PGD73696.1 hypothetical protein COM46_21700 [Bacillus pseudomycoides]